MAAIHADLRIWSGSEPVVAAPPHPRDIAERLFTGEAFRSPPRDFAGAFYSLPWFEQIERQRYARQGYWLPKVLEFKRHAGEALLGLGDVLGTDWVQYARNGAQVIVAIPPRSSSVSSAGISSCAARPAGSFMRRPMPCRSMRHPSTLLAFTAILWTRSRSTRFIGCCGRAER